MSELLDPTHVHLSVESPSERDDQMAGREGLAQLLDRARGEPPLDAAEEQRLARRSELGDAKARERLVNAHVRLVLHIARQHARTRADLPDLVQEGFVGLLRAVDRFDWRRETRLSTYAAFWIRQAMLRSTQGLIRVPELRREQGWAVARARQRLSAELGREPSVAELAAVTGLHEGAVEGALAGTPTTVSVEDNGRDEDGAPTTEHLSSDDDILAELDSSERRQALSGALATLPTRLRAMLQLRYGLDGGRPLSLAEAGNRLGLNRHQAYRLESAGLARLSRDGRLRQAVGKLRSLFPFGLASPWAALKGALSADAGVKAATAVLIVGGAAAVGAWQNLGPFGPDAPSPAPASAAEAPRRAVAAIAPVPSSPTPPASARQRLGGVEGPPARQRKKPPKPQAEQPAAATAPAVQEASQAPSGAEAAQSGSIRPDAAERPRPGSQSQAAQPDAAEELPGAAVGAVEDVIASLPLPPPVEQAAGAAVDAVEEVVELLPAIPEITPPESPAVEPPSGSIPGVGDPAGGLLNP